jgi:hypothetical protein
MKIKIVADTFWMWYRQIKAQPGKILGESSANASQNL